MSATLAKIVVEQAGSWVLVGEVKVADRMAEVARRMQALKLQAVTK